jgi:hypothetical protein
MIFPFEMTKEEEIQFAIDKGGMTRDEAECIYHINHAWGSHSKLPIQHPEDAEEFFRAIHQLQDLMALRTARRDHPEFWKDFTRE